MSVSAPSHTRLRELSRDMRALEEKLREAGGSKRIEKQHSQGKLTLQLSDSLLRCCGAASADQIPHGDRLAQT